MVKRIPLTQGKFALVDDEDYDFLTIWKWNAVKTRKEGLWYAARTGGYRMHRVIDNTPKGFETDHINGDGLDNQRHNLRKATNQQNQANRGPRKGSSKYKGVAWAKAARKWYAYIMVNYKNKSLGHFENEHEAALAYNIAAKAAFGEFARLNEVDSFA